MNQQDYTPNSHKYKAEMKAKQSADAERKIEKVAKGRVTKKKHNRFADVFIAEDASNVKSYMFSEVLIPAAKKLLWDIITDGAGMFLFGETGRASKNRPGASKVSYTKYYEDPRDDRRYSSTGKAKRGFEYDDIIFDNKGDAEVVLDRMCEVIDTYGFVTILDLYDLADLTAPAHTSNRYGWTNLRSAETVRVRDGYILKLPRASVID